MKMSKEEILFYFILLLIVVAVFAMVIGVLADVLIKLVFNICGIAYMRYHKYKVEQLDYFDVIRHYANTGCIYARDIIIEKYSGEIGLSCKVRAKACELSFASYTKNKDTTNIMGKYCSLEIENKGYKIVNINI